MKDAEKSATLEPVVKRLDVIIALILERQQKSNTKANIVKLSQYGLNYREIANILGKKENHIAKELSLMKTATKKAKQDGDSNE